MTDSPLIPGRQRRNSYTGRDRIPVAHVTLGRTHLLRRGTGKAGLHIVTPDGDRWLTLCKQAAAVKSYRGRPDQAGCAECKRAALEASGGAA